MRKRGALRSVCVCESVCERRCESSRELRESLRAGLRIGPGLQASCYRLVGKSERKRSVAKRERFGCVWYNSYNALPTPRVPYARC